MNRQCVILVGGLGTRLGPLTAKCPKPLLPVAGRPFLEYLIEQVAEYGFDDILLLAGYHGREVARHFEESPPLRGRPRVQTVIESELMGTAGALVMHRTAAPSFLLLNGDTCFGCDIGDLVGRVSPEPWLARVALRQVSDASRYGVVVTDDNHRVLSFDEKPGRKEAGMINGGVYWVRRELLERVTCVPLSLERDLFPVLVREGLLYGYPYDGGFIDIGTPETYTAAQNELPAILEFTKKNTDAAL